MRRSRLAAAAVACLVVGVALMIPFEATLTRTLGTLSLLAFIACGALALANPEDLEREDDETLG